MATERNSRVIVKFDICTGFWVLATSNISGCSKQFRATSNISGYSKQFMARPNISELQEANISATTTEKAGERWT